MNTQTFSLKQRTGLIQEIINKKPLMFQVLNFNNSDLYLKSDKELHELVHFINAYLNSQGLDV